MSMLLTDAQTFVARIIGGQDDANLLLSALDSIKATIAKWNALADWTYLLQDNSDATVVTSCVIAGDGVTVTNATTGALFFCNVGQTVTGTGIPANTTISAVTETNDTGVSAFTLSQASTPGTITMTFSALIPLRDGVQTYNLPFNFDKPYSARLNTNPRTLQFYQLREIDRKVANQTRGGVPTHYTIYNTHGFSVNTWHKHLRLYPVMTGSDTLLLKYYRYINDAATTLDVPDAWLYAMLDDARLHLLMQKSEDDPRIPILNQNVQAGIARAIADDQDQSEDQDLRMMSQMESGVQQYVDFNIWTDGIVY